MRKDTKRALVSTPHLAGYVLAAGALVWLAGGGLVPLLVGGLAVALSDSALRRLQSTEPPTQE